MKKLLKNPSVITFAILLIFASIVVTTFFALGITAKPERPSFEVDLRTALTLGTEANYPQFVKKTERSIPVVDDEIKLYVGNYNDEFNFFFGNNCVFRADESLTDEAVICIYYCKYISDGLEYGAEWEMPENVKIGYGNEYISAPSAENCVYVGFVGRSNPFVYRSFGNYIWDETRYGNSYAEFDTLILLPKSCVAYSVSDEGKKYQIFPKTEPSLPKNQNPPDSCEKSANVI